MKRFYIVTKHFEDGGYDKNMFSSTDPKKLIAKAVELLGPLDRDSRAEAGAWLESYKDVPGSCGARLNLGHDDGLSVLVEAIEI